MTRHWYYAAWAWLKGSGGVSFGNSSASELASGSLFQELNRWRDIVGRPEPEWHNPLYGGTNPLHLGHSQWFGYDRIEADESELHFDTATRTAVLIVNQIGSWWRELESCEQRLPTLEAR